MSKAIQLARIGVALDANTINYINDLKKAQIETDKRLDKIDSRYKKSSENLEKSSKKVDTTFELQRNAAGQLGFQLQDVAVQAQMGTDAFIILAQQGSQLAGVFGPGGAMLGAVIAIGGALVGSLVAGLKAAEKEAKALIPTLDEMSSNMSELGVETARLLQLSLSDEMKKDEKQIDILNAKIQSQSRAFGMLSASGRATKEETKQHTKSMIEQRASLEVLTKRVDGYSISLRRANDIVENYQNKNDNVVASEEKLKKTLEEKKAAVSGIITAYQEQLMSLQLTDKQLVIHNALVAGANPLQLKQIELLYDSVTALEAEEKAVTKSNDAKKAAQKFAEKLIEKSLSDEEKLDADAAKLRMSRGLISEELYQSALIAIRNKYTTLDLSREQEQRVRDEAERKARLKAEEEFEMKKRALATDTYNFLSGSNLTSFEKMELDHERELELLRQKYEDQRSLHAENSEALIAIDQQYAERRKQIDKELEQSKIKLALGDIDIIGDAFNQQLRMQETYTKAKIALEEASAISSTLADPTLSFWEKAGAVVSMTAKFAALAGQFHGGTDEVPASMNNKSFMLKAGERVVQPEANKKLTSFLDGQSPGNGGGVGGAVQVTYSPVFNAPVSNEAWFKQELMKNADQVGAIIQKQQSQYPNRGRR